MESTEQITMNESDQKPAARRWGRKTFGFGCSALLCLFCWFLIAGAMRSQPADSGAYYTVVPIDMNLSIGKEGELQAVRNIDVKCPVEGRSTVVQIASEGSYVRKGDVLVMLDTTDLRRLIEGFEQELIQAEAKVAWANGEKELGNMQVLAREQEARVNLELAESELREYVEGTFPQSVAEAKNQIEMARITLKNKEEDLVQVRRMYNRGFKTYAEVRTAEYDVVWARNDLDSKQAKLNVLSDFTYAKTISEKKNKVARTESEVERVRRMNANRKMRKLADVQSATRELAVQQERLARFRKQVENCVIRSPADGLVVYPHELYSGEAVNPLQVGGQVYYDQLLLRIPEINQMQAVVRVSERQVSQLKIDPEKPMRAAVQITGVPEPIMATLSSMSVLADSRDRWWNPDVKEYPVGLTLDATPPGLKPGTSIQAEIFLTRVREALVVPLNAIYQTGEVNRVFIRTPEGPRPQIIETGLTNATHAQVLGGLAPGQEVLLLETGQGGQLLAAMAHADIKRIQ